MNWHNIRSKINWHNIKKSIIYKILTITNTPTHSSGNTLYLVISSSNSNLIIKIKPIIIAYTHLLTDHFTISLTYIISHKYPCYKTTQTTY